MNKPVSPEIIKELHKIRNKCIALIGMFIPLFIAGSVTDKYNINPNMFFIAFVVFLVPFTALWVSIYSTQCPSCKKPFFTKNGWPVFYISLNCKHCGINFITGVQPNEP
jgi:RsiW-degrading membrane proteinase PrsW (M82 family)